MLTSKQKRHLKALGSVLDPVVQVGKSGVLDTVITSTADALKARELIKARALRNCPEEPREVFQTLAQETGAELVQVIGRNALLFKRNEEKPKVELPS